MIGESPPTIVMVQIYIQGFMYQGYDIGKNRKDHCKIYPSKVEFIKYTMKLTGQENPIYVVKRKDKFYVVEGVVRLVAAQEIPMEFLDCIVLDIPDNQVIDQRLRLNQKSKTHIKETCYYVEHMLGMIGKSQGKKHELMGFAKLRFLIKVSEFRRKIWKEYLRGFIV